jgi:rRNA maturation protein Nop10
MSEKVKKCRKCKTKMEYQWSDADDLGGIEEWMECPDCGSTAKVPKK